MHPFFHSLLFLFVTSSGVAQTPHPLPSPSHADVRYGPHERNTLDLWQAPSAAPTPLLIFIHGGGWASGDKTALPAKLLDCILRLQDQPEATPTPEAFLIEHLKAP